MLVESVSVKNFKLLGDFSVGGLRPFTLVGGDNGVGKTTLLEAVKLCFSWNEWAQSKIPPLLEPLRSASIVNDDAFARLSHGGNLDAPITAQCVANNTPYSVKAELARALPTAGGTGTLADVGKIGSVDIRPAKQVQVDYNMGSALYGPFILEVTDEVFKFDRPKGKSAVLLPFQIIVHMLNGGLRADNPADDADCLSSLEDRGGKEVVLEALQIVVPQASDITVGSIRKSPLVVVQTQGTQAKRPSILFGAGTQKILSLALVLGSHENSLFLVDEVTVGWHHSHLIDLWRMIFRVCKERNHQIIATTHSREGIAAFAQAAKAEGSMDDSCYIRLDEVEWETDPKRKIKPSSYSGEKLWYAVHEMETEVR